MKIFARRSLAALALIFTNALWGQCCPHIDTVEVMPLTPTIHDSISIRTMMTIPDYGGKISDTFFLSGDTIHIYNCLAGGSAATPLTIIDTFKIGHLPGGVYIIHLVGYFTSVGPICNPIDTAIRYKAFQVIDDVGLEERRFAHKASVQVYPNPASDQQQLIVVTPIPQTLSIKLIDLSGREVKSVYEGRSVQGRQTFAVDLSRLAKGVYLYQISVGEESKHLKIIVQ